MSNLKETTPDVAEELLDILELERIEDNLFRGRNDSVHTMRLFGGQVLAQAVSAAFNTVPEERPCHSAHGYFLRPGNPKLPVLYRIERIRDGRSFTTRRIVALQNGEAIFSMDASFQVLEAGLEHQISMQDIEGPDELEDDVVVAKGRGVTHPWMLRQRPFECRSVAQLKDPDAPRFENATWIRFRKPVPAGLRYHYQLLAFASDMGFVSTSFLPHQGTASRDNIQMASLDHALWFHQHVDVSEWLLFKRDTTNAESARGFNRGEFYSQDGVLVASAMQEGLIRVRT
jgi:acyl-CoA thioesterase-2